MTRTGENAARRKRGEQATGAPRTYLAELYVPRTTSLEVLAASARAGAEELAGDGIHVEYVRSILVPGDEFGFCLYLAGDADAVARAIRRAGLTCERIVPTQEDE